MKGEIRAIAIGDSDQDTKKTKHMEKTTLLIKEAQDPYFKSQRQT